MNRSALQDAFNGQGLPRLDGDALWDARKAIAHELLEPAPESAKIGSAGTERLRGVGILGERKEQVLERHVLVAHQARTVERLAKGFLKLFIDDGTSHGYASSSCSGSIVRRSGNSCSWANCSTR